MFLFLFDIYATSTYRYHYCEIHTVLRPPFPPESTVEEAGRSSCSRCRRIRHGGGKLPGIGTPSLSKSDSCITSFRQRPSCWYWAARGGGTAFRSAAYVALKYPQAFGVAAVQSVYFGLGAEDELESMIKAKANPDLRLYIDWNQFEERSVDTDFDIGKDSDRLATLFKYQGYRMEGGLMRDSYGWGGWRNRSAQLLAILFPAG